METRKRGRPKGTKDYKPRKPRSTKKKLIKFGIAAQIYRAIYTKLPAGTTIEWCEEALQEKAIKEGIYNPEGGKH